MPRSYDPFAGTDFAQGGAPRGLEEPPVPTALALPPLPTTSDNSRDNARVWQNYLDVLNDFAQLVDVTTEMGGETMTEQKAAIDPRVKDRIDFAQQQITLWLNQAAKEAGEGRARQEKEAGEGRARQETEKSEAGALARAQISAGATLGAAATSAGATLGAAATSAGASRFSAEEATRRQEATDIRAAEEAGLERTFKAGESAATRAGTVEVTRLGSQLAGEREAAQRAFDAEQKALDREIQRIQLEIAQGNLNLNTALGQLEKWLEAQQYTLPEGAEYVPGFQPGGAVAEASRLAGVPYNPANYRAQTVPFDPAALVRQTMGR